MTFSPPVWGGARRTGAYNLSMMSAFAHSVGATVAPRLALLVNHVLAGEPAAVQRLRLHAGKRICLQLCDIPALMSWLPSVLTMTVTPAGLLEWHGDGVDRADLVVSLDASNPAQAVVSAVAGQRPHIEVAGDAALAADVSWLLDHLRWDVQDDLARLVGDGVARQLARGGTAVAEALRRLVRSAVRSAEPPPR